MSMMWVGIGTAVVGAGTSLYGISQQKKANQGAQDTNIAQQDKQNDFAWNNWLMTKGIQPNSPLKAGTMPTAGGYTAVNTRLPLWAKMKMAPTSTSGASVANAKRVRLTGTASAPSVAGADGSPGSTTSSGNRILNNALDPLNLMGSEPRTLKNTTKRLVDPLGIFG